MIRLSTIGADYWEGQIDAGSYDPAAVDDTFYTDAFDTLGGTFDDGTAITDYTNYDDVDTFDGYVDPCTTAVDDPTCM